MLYVGGLVVIVQVYHNALAVEVGGGRGGVWGQVFLVSGLRHGGQLVLQMSVAQLHVALLQQLQLCV